MEAAQEASVPVEPMRWQHSFFGTASRRTAVFAAFVWLAILLFSGCAASPKRAQLTGPPGYQADPDSIQMVGRLSRVWGTKPQRVDGVSLVVGLAGTGSDPPPTAERDALISEMQTRDVDKPNNVLASSSTALVRVSAFIPPGARKGDHFDLYVEVPRETDTTSLEGGWLMATRLHEYAVLGNRIGEGHLLAVGQGDVLSDALMENGDDDVRRLRGRVLGGGVVSKTRGFGLVVRDEFTSVKTSSRIGEAINRRFSVYHNGSKQGVANPKRDDFIELLVHPRYVGNESRYIRVIQNIAVRESPQVRSARLGELRLALGNPATSESAAIKLEAIGEDSIPSLRDAMDSHDFEIRFYAAEALAYQDNAESVRVLMEAVQSEPAFRARALQALGAMDEIASHEALVDLLHSESAEARYGAFRVLRRRTPDDPLVGGRVLNDSFSLHEISTSGPALVHVSRVMRPEIVLFGSGHELRSPVTLFAGEEIVIRDNQQDGLTVSRLSPTDDDEQLTCSRRLIDVINAVTRLKGTYADVVRVLTEAKRSGALASRLEFSAIQTESRKYRRATPDASPADVPPAANALDLAVDDAIGNGPLPSFDESFDESLGESLGEESHSQDLEIMDEFPRNESKIASPSPATHRRPVPVGGEVPRRASGQSIQSGSHRRTYARRPVTPRVRFVDPSAQRALVIPQIPSLIQHKAEVDPDPVIGPAAASQTASVADASEAALDSGTAASVPQRPVSTNDESLDPEAEALQKQISAELAAAPDNSPLHVPSRLNAFPEGESETPEQASVVENVTDLIDVESLPE